MAVIIDTFEVISVGKKKTESSKNGESAGAKLKPADIVSVVEHRYQRKERTRAH